MSLAAVLSILAAVAAAVGLVVVARYVRHMDRDVLESSTEPTDDARQRQAQVGIGLTGGGTMTH